MAGGGDDMQLVRRAHEAASLYHRAKWPTGRAPKLSQALAATKDAGHAYLVIDASGLVVLADNGYRGAGDHVLTPYVGALAGRSQLRVGTVGPFLGGGLVPSPPRRMVDPAGVL